MTEPQQSLYDTAASLGFLTTRSYSSFAAQLGVAWNDAFKTQDLDALIGIARTATFLRSQYDFRFHLLSVGAGARVREMIQCHLNGQNWVSFAKATLVGGQS